MIVIGLVLGAIIAFAMYLNYTARLSHL